MVVCSGDCCGVQQYSSVRYGHVAGCKYLVNIEGAALPAGRCLLYTCTGNM